MPDVHPCPLCCRGVTCTQQQIDQPSALGLISCWLRRAFFSHPPACCGRLRDMKIDSIGGFDARGFILGPPVALALNIPFFMLRKKVRMR